MSSSSPTALSLEPAVGTLRVADGQRLEESAAGTVAMAAPRRAASGRRREHLFILVHLAGPTSSSLYDELCDIASKAYWSTGGSITAALRVAAGAANRHLLYANVRSEPSERCYGTMICAAVSGDEVFLLKAGSVWVCIRHRDWQESLLHGDEVPALGVGAAAPIRLSHATVAAGDTMLLTAPTLTEEEHGEDIAQALGRATLEDAVDGLRETRSTGDFAGLFVRFTSAEAVPVEPEAVQPVAIPVYDVPDDRPMAHIPEVRRAAAPRRARSRRPKPARAPGRTLGQRMATIARPMRAIARRAGRGLASAGTGLVRAPKTVFRAMLPGAARDIQRRERPARPVPPDNRKVMIPVAIGIPVVLAIMVAGAYTQFGTEARFNALVERAQEEAILAQAAGAISEEARQHWEAILPLTAQAIKLRPDDPAMTSLRAQAHAALDRLDGIVRLTAIQLYELGPGTRTRQLVVRGQMILVLDPSDGWVAELTLDQTGGRIERTEEDEAAPVLVRTGQQIAREIVGNLVDLVWADLAGGRQTSGVVILEADGAVTNYDPAWSVEGGAPRLVRTKLGSPPAGIPLSVGSYEGRLYVLAPGDDQIWRYGPSGDTYPEEPESYFSDSPPVPLEEAIDMTIDGYIYILYEGGTILKFLRGQPEPFDVRGVPGDISHAVALATDPSGLSRRIYVADQGNQRVVKLNPDGAFEAQYRADDGFSELEALAIDETAGRLYTVSEGWLYVAPLP